jgi:hypothetical protein
VTEIEQRERLWIDVDPGDRHRERDPQLLVELGECAQVSAVAQADLIAPPARKVPAVRRAFRGRRGWRAGPLPMPAGQPRPSFARPGR